MFNPKEIRKDFPMFKSKIATSGKPFIYLDNAATTLKPIQVIEASDVYALEENANSHRGDYDVAFKVDKKVDETRKNVADFFNAEKKEIIFTSGCSASMNLIAFGYGFKFLTKDDVILLTEAEHASNVLPWFKVSELTGAQIKYIPLDKDGKLDVEGLKKVMDEHVKVISVAQVTNVLGFKNDIKSVAKIAHEFGAICVCDAAQSAPHMAIDVKDLDVDFMTLSAHKMLGPTGVGVLYGKFNLLKEMDPFMTGGGDNARFDMCGNVAFLEPPAKFEAGTLNLEGIYGFNEAINYLRKLGMDNIEKHEIELRKYAISKLKTLQNLTIYNENADSGIITLNVKEVFAQDEASYLNSKGICVRSGEHCAKLLRDRLGEKGTVRISFYIYNTKEDVDALYEALKNGGNFLDAYFD